MDTEKWESVDSMDTSSGVMVSNLPLVFAHGVPKCLSKMTLNELELFVPFMVRCSVGEELKVSWSQLRRPIWWPSKLPFRIPTNCTSNTTKNLLIKLIERCYAFHGCQYLLQFCSSLHQIEPSSGYRFTDNRDGTTSMYHGNTGKLLVTFRNENRDYDKATLKPKRQLSSPKKLLPVSSSSQKNNKNEAMVRPPITDVFLCDKCDDEFTSLKEVQTHEKQCKGDKPTTPKLPSPEPEAVEDEEISDDQVPFLSYLGLKPSEHTGLTPYTSPRKRTSEPVKKLFSQNYFRFDTIDISSPLGRYILSKCKYSGKLQMPQQQVLRYERHVYASPDADQISTRERSTNRWIVVWRQRREEQPWVHLYCFTSKQKKEKEITLQTGLNKRSRMLLAKCKTPRVKLKRLAKRVIDRATRLGGRSAPCIDLTSSEDCGSSSTQVAQPPTFVNDSYASNSLIQIPKHNALSSQSPLKKISSVEVPHPDVLPSQSFPNESLTQGHSINKFHLPHSEAGNWDLEDMVSEFKLKTLTSNGVTISALNSESATSTKDALLGQANSLSLPSCNVHNVNSSPSFNLNKVPNPTSLVSGSSTSSSQFIEVIDLSSDEEDMNRDPENYMRASNKFPYSNSKVSDRSHARSKNGCSHWSLSKHSENGRDQSDLMTNGTTLRSVSPQPPTVTTALPLPFSCSLNSSPLHLANRLEGKLNHSVHNSIISSDLFYKKFLRKPLNRNLSFCASENGENNRKLETSVPKFAQQVDITLESPFQIDEEISFNIQDPKVYESLCCQTLMNNNTIKCVNNNGDALNNNSNIEKSMIYKFADKVNEGLGYLSSFVKSKMYDFSPKSDIPVRDKDELMFDVETTVLNRDASHVSDKLSNRMERITVKKKRMNRKILNDLLQDECRELKRLGIGTLMDISTKNNRNIMTRFRAEKAIANETMFLRNGEVRKCLKNEYKKNRSKNNSHKKISGPKGNSLNFPVEDFKSSDNHCVLLKNGEEDNPTISKIDRTTKSSLSYNNLAESKPDGENLATSISNENFSHSIRTNYEMNVKSKQNIKKVKKVKMSRELRNLSRDECKELREKGFHPSDILGNSEDGSPQIHLIDEDISFSPPTKKRNYPISPKSSRGENSIFSCNDNIMNMIQGNKKLSKELSKLMMDEWKELKRSGSHPSQISGLLSGQRSIRTVPSLKKETLLGNSSSHNKKFNSFCKSTRTQEKVDLHVEIENPRRTHRTIIKSENGMCVLNYTLDNVT